MKIKEKLLQDSREFADIVIMGIYKNIYNDKNGCGVEYKADDFVNYLESEYHIYFKRDEEEIDAIRTLYPNAYYLQRVNGNIAVLFKDEKSEVGSYTRIILPDSEQILACIQETDKNPTFIYKGKTGAVDDHDYDEDDE